MAHIDINELIKILPKLVRENDTVKGAIISALSGVVATHEDVVNLTKEMGKRFEEQNKRFEEQNIKFNSNHSQVIGILESIQQQIGKPFEQFARNVIVRILKGEGHSHIKIENITFEDPQGYVNGENREGEIDGFSEEPPIIVEITSILRNREKVEIFLKKKEFVENKFTKTFKGFIVASSTVFSEDDIADITVLLHSKNCERINL